MYHNNVKIGDEVFVNEERGIVIETTMREGVVVECMVKQENRMIWVRWTDSYLQNQRVLERVG